MPRPVVVDHNLDLAAQPPADHTNRWNRAGHANERAFVEQIVDDLAEAGIVARHHEGDRPAALERERDLGLAPPGSRSAPRPRC